MRVGEGHYDVAVIGAGIVGLAHALAVARRGKSVVVIDRDAQANGASIRNFGFVTVTGQQQGACWSRAMRSRNVWAEIVAEAGIAVAQEGLAVIARRPEALAVLEAFRATEMGRDCRMLSPGQARDRVPALRQDGVAGVMWSPHELRVESRTAIPRLAAWLAERHGVTFLRSTLALAVVPPQISTSRGPVMAETVVVCPGHERLALFPDRLEAYGMADCQLQMLRVAPGKAGVCLGTAVMSDLGLVRYLGYAELPEAGPLRRRLEAEQPDALEHGVHLIAVQSADGTMVVGDSHHYGPTLPPFAADAVDRIILDEFDAVLDVPGRHVTERWVGTYASAPDRLMLVDRPSDAVRIVVVTSGTGASTAFAIAEEVVADLYGPEITA